MDRRGFLRLGGGVTAAGALGLGGTAYAMEQQWLPGRAKLHQLLGQTGDPPRIPDQPVGELVTGELATNRAGGRSVGWSLLRPHGVTAPLPVVIALHGRGGHHDTMLRSIHLGAYLTDSVRRGNAPFAVASVDGFDSYFHPREDGSDLGAVVIDDLLPMLGRRTDITGDKVAFYGMSMGGYGALRIASLLGPERTAAVVATSPAIWRDPDDAPPGSFDSREQFEEHTLFGRQDLLRGIALRIDSGNDDPFRPGVEDYRDSLDPTPEGGFSPGLHDADFAMRQLPAALDFLSEHLTR